MTTFLVLILILIYIGVVLLLVFCGYFYIPYQAYRLDLFRQRLFEIRDELFDKAADGVIDFKSPLYRKTRDIINGYIRFGHRYRCGYLISRALFFLVESRSRDEDDITSFLMQLSQLDEQAQSAILLALVQSHAELIRYVHDRSLFARLSWAVLRRAKSFGAVWSKLRRLFESPKYLKWVMELFRPLNQVGDVLPSHSAGW
ncbi:MAG TPA: hypothetical protein PLD05_14400 [Thermogutta sp.]|nr:hypothetical protein [Thermogutta sp.]